MPGFNFFPPVNVRDRRRTMEREETPAQRAAQRRTVIARSRTGCDNCKRRRIKCDETKPACLRCHRGGRRCSYQLPRTWTFQQSGAASSSGTPEPGGEDSEGTSDLLAYAQTSRGGFEQFTSGYPTSNALTYQHPTYGFDVNNRPNLSNIMGQSLPPPGVAIARSNRPLHLNVKGILQEFLVSIGRCAPHRYMDAVMSSVQLTVSFCSLAASHLSLRNGTFGSDQQTLNVRSYALPQINRLLQSERTQTSDQAMISIGHQLFVDMFIGSPEVIAAHVNGLGHIVEMRGGLSHLGLDGEIAHILKAFVFEACVASEFLPPSAFLQPTQWSPWVDSFDPQNDHFLKSPILWATPPFQSDHRSLPIQGLLDEMRHLTEDFLTGTSTRDSERYVYSQILAQNSTPLVAADKGSQSGWICETLRLTSLIFAAAISYRLPVSRAVWRAAADTGDPTLLERLCNAFTQSGYTAAPYWDDYASSLLWASLVASAVARCNDDLVGMEDFVRRSQSRRAQLTMPLAVGARFCHTHLHAEAFLSIETMLGVQAKLAGRALDQEPL